MADLHVKKTTIALWYTRTAWQSHCKLDSFDLDYALLASVLGQLNPETWLSLLLLLIRWVYQAVPLDSSAEATASIMSWHNFVAPFEENLHAQASVSQFTLPNHPSRCSPSSSVPVPIQGNIQLYVFGTFLSLIGTLFTSSKYPAIVAALMCLTSLRPATSKPTHPQGRQCASSCEE